MKTTETQTTPVVENIVNGVSVDSLSKTVGAIKATPALAKFNFRVRNQWVDGGRNISTAGNFYGAGTEHTRAKSFVLEADEPPVLLGKDLAANPVEHLPACPGRLSDFIHGLSRGSARHSYRRSGVFFGR